MTMERKEAKGFFDGEKYTKVEEGDIDPSENQVITLTCFPTFSGTQPLKNFLNHVRGFSNPAHDAMLQVWTPSGPNGTWWDCNDRPARKLAGVVMEKAKKDPLVSDIEYYLTSACTKYYQNRGIPYRRGYLAFGPPGTGKTSMALALASHFKLPIYLLRMSDPGLNDKTLEGLFSILPRRCILLLEDVDSAGLQRENMAEATDFNSSKKAKKGKSSAKKSLTLSGLLNAFDGPASDDGRILFMTSNSPDTLDAALVRPGRCDVKILLGYASPEVIETTFSRIYTTSADGTSNQGENFADSMDIPAMAAEFASKIPLNAPITPAETQAWLLVNRLSPKAAVEGAAEWAQEIVDNKKRGANVASFANEIDKDASSTIHPSPTSSPSQWTTHSDNESDNDSGNDSDDDSDNDSDKVSGNESED